MAIAAYNGAGGPLGPAPDVIQCPACGLDATLLGWHEASCKHMYECQCREVLALDRSDAIYHAAIRTESGAKIVHTLRPQSAESELEPQTYCGRPASQVLTALRGARDIQGVRRLTMLPCRECRTLSAAVGHTTRRQKRTEE